MSVFSFSTCTLHHSRGRLYLYLCQNCGTVVSNGGTAVLLVPEVLLGAGDDGHVAGPAVHLLHRRGHAHAHRRVQAGGRA